MNLYESLVGHTHIVDVLGIYYLSRGTPYSRIRALHHKHVEINETNDLV